MNARRLAMVGWMGAAALALGLGAASCSSSASHVRGSDASTDATGATGTHCTTTADCVPPPTIPANCASGSCDLVTGTCSFSAKDEDLDQHTAADCKSTNGVVVKAGDDCNDHDPNLYPNHPEPCSAGPDGGMLPDVCKKGELSCLADGTESTCEGLVAACVNTTCVNQACVGTCAMGQSQCSGNDLQKCQGDGTWGANTPCNDETCTVGEAGSASCSGPCSPGQTQCAGMGGVQQCVDGTWSSTVSCSPQQTCIPSAGTGTAACGGVCGPGQSVCDDMNNMTTCGATGAFGTPVSCTSMSMTCIASGMTASCQGVCAVGAQRCNGTTASETCNSSGEWVSTTCPQGGVCTGQGVCMGSCVPLAKQCIGTTPQTCSATGEWVTGPVTGGTCGAQCTPTQTGCTVGAAPETCLPTGTWSVGQVTVGQCGAVCAPGATENCNGAPACNPSVLTCQSNGSWPSACPAADNATFMGVSVGGSCTVGVGVCARTGNVVCTSPTTAGCSVSPGAPITTGGTLENGAFFSAPMNGSWDYNCDGVDEPYFPIVGYNTTPGNGYNQTNKFNCASQNNQTSCQEKWGCPGNTDAQTELDAKPWQGCVNAPIEGYAWYWYDTGNDNPSQPNNGCGQPIQELSCYWSTNSNECKGEGVDAYFAGYSQMAAPMPCR